jgi:hypothetical protein
MDPTGKATKESGSGSAGTSTDLAPTNGTTPPGAPQPTWQAVLHESFSIILATTVLVLTVWMIARTFSNGSETFSPQDNALKKEAYERQKDIMLYGLSLLGTVTGYYLGRVPAERRADSAQQTADKAQKRADESQRTTSSVQEALAGAREEAAKASASNAQVLARQQRLRIAAEQVVRALPIREVSASVEQGGGAEPRTSARTVPAASQAQVALDRLEAVLSEVD